MPVRSEPIFPALARFAQLSAAAKPTEADLASDADLELFLAIGGVHSVYQPIVELATGATVGYEALARGPGGSPLELPDLLFAAARRAGRLVELDRACQDAALAGARVSALRPPWTLFVNIEPETAEATLLALVRAGESAHLSNLGGPDDFQIIVELTERALIAYPTQLLRLVAQIRARGWGIALDDVGAVRDSLALLPLLRPDVIKLDLPLVQRHPSAQIAEIVSAVNAEAERSGTIVLAEGIETEEHRNVALSFGATLGQGWLLGRPAALPVAMPAFAGTPVRIVSHVDPGPAPSPFALGAEVRSTRTARKAMLIEISKLLERQAMNLGEATVVLATFQDASFFTPATGRRYRQLAAHAAFVGALGEGMPAQPLPGVRGCILESDDPLIGEWDIVVVGSHFAATLVARDLGDTGPDSERRFEFVLSHDRKLATRVALALMERVWPEP